MCGIVGYISTGDDVFVNPKAHFMRFALALDTLRGEDSTGVMTIKNRFKVNVVKSILPGDKFVHSDQYLKNCKPGWAAVGHNRAATKGSVKKENAHPFDMGHVTLVHNGTLYKDGSSLSTYDKSLEVDSMQIAKALNDHGPEDANTILTEVDGSFALVWFDRRDESINMARNSDRPLHFGFNSDKTIMWFMSDSNHLHSVNNSLKGHASAALAVYQLDKMKWLKWHKGSLVPEVTTFAPFLRKPVVIYPPAARKDSDSLGLSSPLKTVTSQYNSKREEVHHVGEGAAHMDKTLVNGILRKIPAPHVRALKEEFDFGPSELLRFTPQDLFDLGKHLMMVTGEVHLPATNWNGIPWSAVIHNVKELQAKAYRSYDWLVRPVGLGLPVGLADDKAPSILCHLIHCKWRDYEKTLQQNARVKIQPAPEEAPLDVQVKGPGGRWMSAKELRAKCDAGCITCTVQLTLEDAEEAVIVNEGRDLLCRGCQNDLIKPPIQQLTKNSLH